MPTPMLKVAKWDEWQSYRKDRGPPPWIKVHRKVLRNPEWVSLTDQQRAHLVTIWILAAEKDGEVPGSSKLIQRLGCLDEEPDIEALIQLGFLLRTKRRPAGVKLASSWRQGDAPEKKREETEEIQKREDSSARAAARPANGAIDFEPFKAVYPKRAGSQRWQRAAQAANARMREGSTFADMVAGAERYARFCKAMGKVGSEYVMQAATFLGPDRHYLEPWEPPASKGEARSQANRDLLREFIDGE